MVRSRAPLVLLLALLCTACAPMPVAEQEPPFDAELERLAGFLQGSFVAPAARDAAGADAEPMPALVIRREDRGGEHEAWFGVKHGGTAGSDASGGADRFWRLRRSGPDSFELDAFGGVGEGDAMPDRTLASGCTFVLERLGRDTYVGGRNGPACEIDPEGVATMIVSLVVTPVEMRSWVRGFDRNGRLVHGRSDGPTILRKID